METWESVRYRLEMKFGLQNTDADAYIEAWHANDKQQETLKSTFKFTENETQLVLRRRPLPPNTKPYCPPQHADEAITFADTMTESDKINVITSMGPIYASAADQSTGPKYLKNPDGTYERLGKVTMICHAADFDQQAKKAIDVNPNFKCRRCLCVGKHWEEFCPTWLDPSFQPKKRRPLPSGILMIHLRRALPHEEDKAYEKHDGSLWVMKDNVEDHSLLTSFAKLSLRPPSP